jgi:chemotaxis protein CheC
MDKFMSDNMTHLTDFQHDALKEVGNIGMGNAATSLSKLVNKKVNIDVPTLKLKLIENVPDMVVGAESHVSGTFMFVKGNLKGCILILFPTKTTNMICQVLSGSEEIDFLSEMNMSLMQEVGHILAGTYVSALADFFHMSISISPPYGTYDMAGAILDYILIEMSRNVEHALVFDTTFIFERNKCEGNFFLLLDPSSLDLVLKKIDEMVS